MKRTINALLLLLAICFLRCQAIREITKFSDLRGLGSSAAQVQFFWFLFHFYTLSNWLADGRSPFLVVETFHRESLARKRTFADLCHSGSQYKNCLQLFLGSCKQVGWKGGLAPRAPYDLKTPLMTSCHPMSPRHHLYSPISVAVFTSPSPSGLIAICYSWIPSCVPPGSKRNLATNKFCRYKTFKDYY